MSNRTKAPAPKMPAPVQPDATTDAEATAEVPSVIEVVALRPGFYGQNRYAEGDKFVIQSYDEFGDWMQCTDPVHAKAHAEIIKARKAGQ